MLVLLIAQIVTTAPADVEADALARYRALTSAEPRCERRADETDVTVCGLRAADRFRVPFVFPEPGDPLHEAVPAERQRYLARTTKCQDMSLFQVSCGSWGLSVTTGGGRERVEVRPLAK